MFNGQRVYRYTYRSNLLWRDFEEGRLEASLGERGGRIAAQHVLRQVAKLVDRLHVLVQQGHFRPILIRIQGYFDEKEHNISRFNDVIIRHRFVYANYTRSVEWSDVDGLIDGQ